MWRLLESFRFLRCAMHKNCWVGDRKGKKNFQPRQKIVFQPFNAHFLPVPYCKMFEVINSWFFAFDKQKIQQSKRKQTRIMQHQIFLSDNFLCSKCALEGLVNKVHFTPTLAPSIECFHIYRYELRVASVDIIIEHIVNQPQCVWRFSLIVEVLWHKK